MTHSGRGAALQGPFTSTDWDEMCSRFSNGSKRFQRPMVRRAASDQPSLPSVDLFVGGATWDPILNESCLLTMW